MQKSLIASSFIVLLAGLAGCETSGPTAAPVAAAPVPVVIDPAIGNPCTEAAMAKYFIAQDRVVLLSATPQAGATSVVMKADTRDAVCVVNTKGKVVTITDTTPKSANQIAAEEAAATAAANPVEPAKIVKKKKIAKKAVKKPVMATPAVTDAAKPVVDATKPATVAPVTPKN